MTTSSPAHSQSHPVGPAIVLVLAGLGALWLCFAGAPSLLDPPSEVKRLSWQPDWWTAVFQLQLLVGLLLVGSVTMHDLTYRRRMRNAWPDRLDDLLLPYLKWPGFIQVEAAFGSIVLVLGAYQLIRADVPGWFLPAAIFAISMSSGVACLFVVYRRWGPNMAALGMALVSLGFVGMACALATFFYDHHATAEYADRAPILFNAILIASWFSAGVWFWLAKIWDQQLLDGEPWTTAGRLIPYTKRMAFMVLAIGVLVAFQMARWHSIANDDSLSRILCGSLTLLALTRQSAFAARRQSSMPFAVLAICFVFCIGFFVFPRLPTSPSRGWIVQYGTIVLSLLAMPILVAAEALDRTSWRMFSTPLWFVALLILPAWSLLTLLPSQRPPAAWVEPSTLAVLGGVYVAAAMREKRRAFLVLTTVLWLGAAAAVVRLYG